MARGVVFQDSCDSCIYLGEEGVVAEHKHTISIDGGPPKKLDFCGRCEKRELSHLLAVYTECGQEVERTKPEPKKGQAAPALKPPADEPKPKQFIICPLDHPSSGGGSKRVNYGSRGSHAKVVHSLDISGISWEDPDGIFTVYCEAHKECLTNRLGFTSAMGLTTHVNTAPLERIDI